MSDATTATAPAAAPAPDATAAAPAAAPAPTAAPAAAAPAPTAAPAPAATPAPTAAPAAAPKADDKPAATGAPEAYTDFTLPEGVKVDAERMGKFTEWAKAHNLSQEAAQQAMDMHAATAGQLKEHLATQLEEQAQVWADASKADKEFGGDKFDENLAVAKVALEQFATPEFKAFLDASKLGFHPEMLRFAYRVGKAVSQDGFVPGRQGAPTRTAQGFYSASNMNP